MFKKICIAIILFFLALITVGLIFSPNYSPKTQVAFVDELNTFRDAYDQAEEEGNDIKQNKIIFETSKFLDEPRDVVFWYTDVEGVSIYDGVLYIKTRYTSNQHDSYKDYAQIFRLKIVNSEVQKYFINLKKGDKVFFSGSLGKERSITFTGKIEEPEYWLSPTKIKLSLNGDELI